MTRLLALIAFVVGLAGAPALAGDLSSLMPAVPKASGEPHPEGNAFMRRNHMELMKHDRDLALREGETDIGASIGQCFDCHAVKDEAGDYVRYEDSEQHFCRTCHEYAAVNVDCFMCHRSTPSEEDHAMVGTDEDQSSITAYLERLKAAGEASE